MIVLDLGIIPKILSIFGTTVQLGMIEQPQEFFFPGF